MGPFREHGRPSGSIFGPLEIKIAAITEQSVRSVRHLRESAFRILRIIDKPLFSPESLDKTCGEKEREKERAKRREQERERERRREKDEITISNPVLSRTKGASGTILC